MMGGLNLRLQPPPKSPQNRDMNNKITNNIKVSDERFNDSNPFFKPPEVKPFLNVERLTGEDLKRHLLLTFGSIKIAGQRAGYGDDVRVVQILSGYCVPKRPDLIKRIAEAWHIDLVVLTQLFERLRKGGGNGNS